jgi:hypothetical protein
MCIRFGSSSGKANVYGGLDDQIEAIGRSEKSYYNNMSVETKAQAFEPELIKNLERIYAYHRDLYSDEQLREYSWPETVHRVFIRPR